MEHIIITDFLIKYDESTLTSDPLILIFAFLVSEQTNVNSLFHELYEQSPKVSLEKKRKRKKKLEQ